VTDDPIRHFGTSPVLRDHVVGDGVGQEFSLNSYIRRHGLTGLKCLLQEVVVLDTYDDQRKAEDRIGVKQRNCTTSRLDDQLSQILDFTVDERICAHLVEADDQRLPAVIDDASRDAAAWRGRRVDDWSGAALATGLSDDANRRARTAAASQ
jgi:hypothetical protein